MVRPRAISDNTPYVYVFRRKAFSKPSKVSKLFTRLVYFSERRRVFRAVALACVLFIFNRSYTSRSTYITLAEALPSTIKRQQDVARAVTVIIKSFERHSHLDRLVGSIQTFFPSMQILVADDSRAKSAGLAWFERQHPSVMVFTMPFDQGNSRGRNLLLSQVTTEYFLTVDDDFIFRNDTRLESLLDVLETNTNISIACGSVEKVSYAGKFRIERTVSGRVLVYDKLEIGTSHVGKCHVVDVCPQFFIGRVAAVRAFGGWNDQFKVMDHSAFFMRAWRSPEIQIVFCSHVTVGHATSWIESFPLPWSMSRGRALLEFELFLQVHKLTAVRQFDGHLMRKEDALSMFKTKSQNFEQVRSPYHSFGHSYFLGICILSAPHNFKRRAAIRNGWLRYVEQERIGIGHTRFLHRFVIAMSENSTLNYALIQESNRNGDILFLPDVIDSYANLTAKTLHCISFMGHYHLNFVLKTDDDTYVYLDRLLERLRAPDLRGKHATNVFMGSMKNQGVIRSRESKYYDPDYHGSVYPQLARGGAYVISGDVASYITKTEDYLFKYVLEDAAVAIWTAPLGLRLINESRLFQGYFPSHPTRYLETIDGMATVQTTLSQLSSIWKREELANDVNFGRVLPDGTRQQYATVDCPSGENKTSHNDAGISRKHFNARLNLLDAKQILQGDLGIDFYLVAGGLLGFALHCSPVPWDKDLDLGILASDFSEEIVPAFVNAGFSVYRIFGDVSLGWEASFRKRGIKLDVNCIYEYEHDASVFWQGLWWRGQLKKLGFPRFEPAWIDFLGVRVLAPKEYELYLATFYGPEWRSPDPDYHWWESRTNVLGKVERHPEIEKKASELHLLVNK